MGRYYEAAAPPVNDKSMGFVCAYAPHPTLHGTSLNYINIVIKTRLTLSNRETGVFYPIYISFVFSLQSQSVNKPIIIITVIMLITIVTLS